MGILIILCAIIGADIFWHIHQHREIKHLDECWNHVFNSKLGSERRYQEMLNSQCRTILDLQKQLDEATKKKTSKKK